MIRHTTAIQTTYSILISRRLFRSAITDYFPKWRVPKTRKAFEWANLGVMLLAGWGYYEFETNDVGLTEGIKRIWRAGSVKEGTA